MRTLGGPIDSHLYGCGVDVDVNVDAGLGVEERRAGSVH